MNIKDFMPWVRVIAVEIYRPLPACIMLDDLVQDGMIGLIMAFREFKTDAGIPFNTFAGNKIRWSIMDGLRAGDWAERSVRGRANKLAKTIDKLQSALHREPTKSEIAEALGIRVSDVSSILGEAYGYNFISIDDENLVEIHSIADSNLDPSSIVERRMTYTRALAGLRMLDPKERKAFILRIMCDMSGRQAADEMGISESRVSQLYKSASEKLAEYVSC
ncbi:MAG: sigma-70 family RNA polymerase sigma factor [Gallionellaceae bacterium]